MDKDQERAMWNAYGQIGRAAKSIKAAEETLRGLGILDEWAEIVGEHSFGETPGAAILKAVRSCLESKKPQW